MKPLQVEIVIGVKMIQVVTKNWKNFDTLYLDKDQEATEEQNYSRALRCLANEIDPIEHGLDKR